MPAQQVSEEEIQEAAYYSCMQVFITLKERDCASIVTDDALIDEVISETVIHHKEHLRVHEVEQRHVDAYKIVSWLGCILLKKLVQSQKKNSMEPDSGIQFNMVAGALVDLLGGFFYEDKDIRLPDEMLDFLIKMLYEEAYNNGDHGIWMNGLYMAFHSAVVATDLQATAETA